MSKLTIAHNLAILEKLVDELYFLQNTTCFNSAIGLARRKIFEISLNMSNIELSEERNEQILHKINAIQSKLDGFARNRCRSIRIASY